MAAVQLCCAVLSCRPCWVGVWSLCRRFGGKTSLSQAVPCYNTPSWSAPLAAKSCPWSSQTEAPSVVIGMIIFNGMTWIITTSGAFSLLTITNPSPCLPCICPKQTLSTLQRMGCPHPFNLSPQPPPNQNNGSRQYSYETCDRLSFLFPYLQRHGQLLQLAGDYSVDL